VHALAELHETEVSNTVAALAGTAMCANRHLVPFQISASK
jgi:hypothetical protein